MLKSRIDAKVGKNVTVTPLIAEIKKTLGKQLDIDFKKEMGGKKDGQLRKYLLRNKAAILENMTTTLLMTAMHNAVKKQLTAYGLAIGKVKRLIENLYLQIARGVHQAQSSLECYLKQLQDYLMLITCLTF